VSPGSDLGHTEHRYNCNRRGEDDPVIDEIPKPEDTLKPGACCRVRAGGLQWDLPALWRGSYGIHKEFWLSSLNPLEDALLPAGLDVVFVCGPD
jgi:hypothetical protein